MLFSFIDQIPPTYVISVDSDQLTRERSVLNLTISWHTSFIFLPKSIIFCLKSIMKKQIFTFVVGAAAGGSTIAFASKHDSKVEHIVPDAAISYLKTSADKAKLKIDEMKGGSRFIERSSPKTGWESFDLSPTQE